MWYFQSMENVSMTDEEPSWQLIVQLPTTGAVEDFDVLVDLETAIETALGLEGFGEIDGNDFGSGTMNVYGWVRPSCWAGVIEVTETLLAERQLLEHALIARRDVYDKDEQIIVVRPLDYVGKFSYF